MKNIFLQVNSYYFLLSSFFIISFSILLLSCQIAKKAEDTDENQTEKLTQDLKQQELQQQKLDSLQNEFCMCLIQDSISREKRLENIDNFISQTININIPCSFEEEVATNSVGNLLVNLGVNISNFVLRTNFNKKQSKSKIIKKSYPILMLFTEDTTMISALVARGADVNVKTKDVVSLPEYYISQSNLEKTRFVLTKGTKTEDVLLLTNNEKILDLLLEKGANSQNIDKPLLFNKDNYKKLAEKYKIDLKSTSCTDFSKIVEVGNFQKINFERTEWLLTNGISASCIEGSFLENIIDENFDKNTFNSTSKTKIPPHTQEEWIFLMEKYHINWNQCTKFGKTPLILAVEKQNIELIKKLLNQNADVNFACSFAGQTKTVKDILNEKTQAAQNNENRKIESEKEKYTSKDAEKYATYIKKLAAIQLLLEKR